MIFPCWINLNNECFLYVFLKQTGQRVFKNLESLKQLDASLSLVCLFCSIVENLSCAHHVIDFLQYALYLKQCVYVFLISGFANQGLSAQARLLKLSKIQSLVVCYTDAAGERNISVCFILYTLKSEEAH